MRTGRETGGGFGVVVAPAVIALIVSLAVFGFALKRMAEEVDRLVFINERNAVGAAVSSLLGRLELTQTDYAVWDEAFERLQGDVDPDFVDDNFVNTTETGRLFDGAYLVDLDGGDLFGFRHGEPDARPTAEVFGPELLTLIRSLAPRFAAYAVRHALFATPEGIAAVVVGPVLRNDGSMPAGTRPRFLVLAVYLDEARIAGLAREFTIDGLALHRGPPDPAARGLEIRDASGAAIGNLTWSDTKAGALALEEIGPSVAAVLLAVILMFALGLRYSWRSMRLVVASRQEAQHAALHDTLTGLPNRTAFRTRLERLVAASQKLRSIAILSIDLDGFKEINDAFGHRTGDDVLARVAELIRQAVAGHDMFARVGGDEFAVLIVGENAEAVGTTVGRNLLDQLANPMVVEGRVVRIGASVGVADNDEAGLSASELTRRAAAAMYRAKALGRDRVVAYQRALDLATRERRAIADELRAALDAGGSDIQVLYQPVFDAVTRRLAGAEALVRWMRPGKVSIGPDVFVPIAEDYAIIGQLGAMVLRRACTAAAGWKGLGVSVNVSPAQFDDPKFETVLGDVLKESGLPPDRLILEITETYLIADPERAKKTINAIRGMGVRVALDDFGTGFSSLGYLRRFTFDILKLDRSLVSGIGRDSSTQKLVQATVALAEALGMSVTAEGIENEEELLMLRLAGCKNFQGYLFARPLAAAEIVHLVEEAAGAPAGETTTS